MGRAYHEASGGIDEVLSDERYRALFDAIDTMKDDVAQSDEVLALNDEWSRCMADADYADLASPLVAQATAQQAFGAAVAQDDLDAVLPTVQREEIDLAVADATCRRTVDYTARYDQVLWRAEAELVVHFRDDLEALALEQR